MPAIFSYELEPITRALDAGASPVLASGIGAASRISGVSPADISVLLIYLDLKNRRNEEENT